MNLTPVFYFGGKETAHGNNVTCVAAASLTRVTADPVSISKRREVSYSLRVIV